MLDKTTDNREAGFSHLRRDEFQTLPLAILLVLNDVEENRVVHFERRIAWLYNRNIVVRRAVRKNLVSDATEPTKQREYSQAFQRSP